MRSGLARSTLGIAMRSGGAATATGALAELNGHTDGMAFVAANGNGVGEVAVKDTGTPSNNLTNAAASELFDNDGTSAKYTAGESALVTYSSGSPAFQWDGGAWRMLTERSATNLITNSSSLNAASWTADDTSVTANASVAPDGTTTADRLFDSAVSSRHIHYDGVGGTGRPTFSAFLKNGTLRYAGLGVHVSASSSTVDVLADLENGSILETQANGSGVVEASAIDAVGGYQRVSVSGSGINFSFGVLILSDRNTFVGAENGNTIEYTGTGQYVDVWGVQFEANSEVATSYIPTSGVTATRAADQVHFDLSSINWSATANTVFWKGTTPRDGVDAVLWSIDDGTADERFRLVYASGNVRFVVTDGGSEVANIDLGAKAADATIQVTVAWEADNVAASIDGGAASTDTDTGAGLPTVTTWRLGYSPAGEQGVIYTDKVVHVPERVSDGDLPTWRYAA